MFDYGVQSEQPPRVRILFVVRDLVVAAKLRADLGDAALSTVAPDFNCYETDFDVIVVCFEITRDDDQRWFHDTVKPKLARNGKIYWPS